VADERKHVGNGGNDADKNHSGGLMSLSSSRLEMKWSLVLKLQKHKLDLENQLEQLQKQIEKYENGEIGTVENGGGRKKGKSQFIPKQVLFVLQGHRLQITSLAFHPKYALMASSSEDCSIRFWDYESGAQENLLKGHLNMVNDIQFNKEGDLLVSCSNDLSVRLWSAESGWQMTRLMNGHEHIVSSVRFVGPDDKRVMSASRDGTLKLWEASSGFCLRTFRGHDDWVRSLDVSEDGSIMVSASDDKTLKTWNISNGQCLKTFRGHSHNIEFVHFSPASVNQTMREAHGAIIAGGNSKGSSLANGESKEPSAQFFISGSRDKTLRIWNTISGQLMCTLKGHDNWVRDAYFHPNGLHVVSCSDDKSIRIWDLRTALQIRMIDNAHSHFISKIQLSPTNESIVATASVDNSIKIWKCT